MREAKDESFCLFTEAHQDSVIERIYSSLSVRFTIYYLVSNIFKDGLHVYINPYVFHFLFTRL